MKRNVIIQTLSLGLFFAWSGHSFAATTAYQCIGEDGSISFWDKKPTEGCAKVTTIKTHVGKGSAGSHQNGSSSSLNEEDRKVAEAREQEMKQREKKGKEACEGKRKNLKLLKERARVRIPTEGGGSRMLSPEEHQDKVEEIEKYIKDAC